METKREVEAATPAPDVTEEIVLQMMQTSTLEVFGMMLGQEVEAGQARREATEPGPQDGVVALVGLAGSWVGTGMLRMKGETACAASGLLLMQEFTGVDEEVLDAVGEIANMIFGNVKSGLEEKLGPMGLSIPTVVYGRNFSTRSVGKSEWTVAPFRWDGHEVEAYLCLTPAQKTVHGPRVGPTLALAG
jgi:chemotaxis protein CheX